MKIQSGRKKNVSFRPLRKNLQTYFEQLRRSKFYLPTDAQKNCFKTILKFTLKQLLHVSVQSPSSGSVLFELAKVIVIKIIS
jgi:hypothetical protein